MNSKLWEWKTEKHKIEMLNCGGGLRADENWMMQGPWRFVVMCYSKMGSESNLWPLNCESDINRVPTIFWWWNSKTFQGLSRTL